MTSPPFAGDRPLAHVPDAAGDYGPWGTTARGTAANKALVIDTTAPSISSITSTTANGTYGVGTAINVTLNFSEAVTLAGGNLLVTLETGTTDRQVTISTVSDATSASGTYTVQAGDASPDLSVSSVTLAPGATLKDAAGNGANLDVPSGQNLNDNKDIAVSTMRALSVVSPYGSPSPSVGTHDYAAGASITCSVASPATQEDSQSHVTAVCTGWVATGSVPASGKTTDTGSFGLNVDSTITWRWIVTRLVVSNQTVSSSGDVEARDSITAKAGYRVVAPGAVVFRVGSTGVVSLADGFEARTGSVFRVEIP
jgi:hypothetical protein